ncbi:hypothetical protein HYH03_013592 [Edaphochlamys debaryana]|uniref:Uncharacterized protein n=1 Tax=Edaphochlamys debaryana TaxID=47281 RepID=A0A835XQL8_9CHLO|nr:hypothetical protein HYH03_013592 [Edaphochlamys debaryana]|eukprot:KAG2487747.1 hypothetical protein HYH03_013592 [Edaphochlamys debaryana]
MGVIDKQLFNERDDDLYEYFVDHGQEHIILALRNVEPKRYYDPSFETKVEGAFGFRLQNGYVAKYMAAGLASLCRAVIKKTHARLNIKLKTENDSDDDDFEEDWEFGVPDIVDAWLRDRDLLAIADRVAFNIRGYHTAKKATPQAKRLPKVWYIKESMDAAEDSDLTDPVVRMAVEEFRDRWAPGDLVEVNGEYRGNFIYIIGIDNEPKSAPQYNNAMGYIPADIVQIALDNGFGIGDIIKAYDTRASVLYYPEQLGRGDFVYSIMDRMDVEKWTYDY